MPNPVVTVSLANPDPLANPKNLQGVVDVFNPLFQASLTGTFIPYVISSTTPAVGDQDKVWAKIDGNGRPLEFRLFYNGNWRRFYTGRAGEIAFFSGDPSVYFDGTHLGIIGLDWDGWALCTATGNTNHGVPNLSDKFIVGGNAYSTNWQSKVEDGATLKQSGGASQYAIKNTDLPSMKVFVTGAHYSAGAATGVQRVLVDGDHNNVIVTDNNAIASFGADPTATPPIVQTTISTTGPYYALAFAAFIGYA